MYAFWRYDIFPFVLHGEVVAGPNDSGLVQIKEYACSRRDGTYGGGWVRPLLILSYKGGLSVASNIIRLKEEYGEARSLLEDDFRHKLESNLPKELLIPRCQNK